MQSSLCVRCGQAATCSDPLRCGEVRELMAITAAGERRFCHDCLLRDARQSIQDWLDKHPVGIRVPEAWHGKTQREGIDYYRERGNWVFTEWYHRKRGRCCGSGCRHCPWRSKANQP